MIVSNPGSHWQNKNKIWQCQQCEVGLGITHWKHHCRSCGKVFCGQCCSYYTKIPSEDLCSDRPKRTLTRKAQKCCFNCHNKAKIHVMTRDPDLTPQSRALRGILGIQPFDPPHTPTNKNKNISRVYAIQLPFNRSVQSSHVVQVKLDGVQYETVVPEGLGAGDLFYVRANDGILDSCESDINSYDEIIMLNSTHIVTNR